MRGRGAGGGDADGPSGGRSAARLDGRCRTTGERTKTPHTVSFWRSHVTAPDLYLGEAVIRMTLDTKFYKFQIFSF